jgi:hypothetical protein
MGIEARGIYATGIEEMTKQENGMRRNDKNI